MHVYHVDRVAQPNGRRFASRKAASGREPHLSCLARTVAPTGWCWDRVARLVLPPQPPFFEKSWLAWTWEALARCTLTVAGATSRTIRVPLIQSATHKTLSDCSTTDSAHRTTARRWPPCGNAPQCDTMVNQCSKPRAHVARCSHEHAETQPHVFRPRSPVHHAAESLTQTTQLSALGPAVRHT